MLASFVALTEIPERYAKKLSYFTGYGERVSYEFIKNFARLLEYADNNGNQYCSVDFNDSSYIHVRDNTTIVLYFSGECAISSTSNNSFMIVPFTSFDDLMKVLDNYD